METKPNRPEILAHKLLVGQLSEAEQLELQQWYAKDLDGIVEIPADFARSESEHRERILAGINSKISYGSRSVVRLWKRIAVAASIVLCLGLGYYFYQGSTSSKDGLVETYADIAPGKDGATLTLANGKKILVSDALVGNVASEDGVKISKNADGQIVYELSGEGGDGLAFNTLSTSRGQQSQVRLPDGSVVFLNAESSLRYPVSFVKQANREVALIGEGYFEVAKDKTHPFVVLSTGQRVEVLGTHFNVNAYGGQSAVKTTLLEGAVVVDSKLGKVRLSPGEQTILDSKGIAVEKANLEESMAWRNGKFIFNDESLESIMQRVSRWYDVEVVFDDHVEAIKFIGAVSSDKKISTVLDFFKETENVTYSINGRKVFLSKRIK